jgi:hypothetical protein
MNLPTRPFRGGGGVISSYVTREKRGKRVRDKGKKCARGEPVNLGVGRGGGGCLGIFSVGGVSKVDLP